MKFNGWKSTGTQILPSPATLAWPILEKSMDSEKPNPEIQETALSAIRQLLHTGSLPEDLPQGTREDAEFGEIIFELEQILNTLVALSAGDFRSEVGGQGRFASEFKTFQAALRHSQELSDRNIQALNEESTTVQNLMNEAHQAREQAEAANATLRSRIEEIQALQNQLKDQAMRDPITGCFNRRYLEETLQREFSRAKRENYPLSLVMVDVDHFKQTNDTYGHPAGDAVLQALGILLRGQTRAGDIVCRYGGDEFLIVLPNMKPEDVLRRAECWRAAFHDTEIYYGDLQIQSTISIGIASSPAQGGETGELIRAVDQALYRAKNTGRNCVISAE